MNIATELTPPLKTSLPYFVLGVLAYLIFSISLLQLSTHITLLDFKMAALIHLYVFGFIMIVIYGAYAQLIPVLFEKKHAYISLYKFIWPLHLIALILILFSFLFEIKLLGLSALISLISILMLGFESLFTMKGKKNRSNIHKAILASFVFLFIGIFAAFMMSASFLGLISIDFSLWLKIHIISILFGFVFLSLITFSMVLIPMFSLPRNYNQHAYTLSVYTLYTSILLFYAALVWDLHVIEIASYTLMLISLLAYAIQLFHFHLKRVRIEHDIYAKTLYVSFVSLLLSILFFVLFTINEQISFLHAALSFFAMGFLGSFITANLYKIVPFLIWQKRFAPLIEEQTVPMLHEMIAAKLADAQWFFSSLGIFIIGFGLLLGLDSLLFYGSYLFAVGACCLAWGIKYMLGVKA